MKKRHRVGKAGRIERLVDSFYREHGFLGSPEERMRADIRAGVDPLRELEEAQATLRASPSFKSVALARKVEELLALRRRLE